MTTGLMLKPNTDLNTDLLKKMAGDDDYLGYLTQVQKNADLAGPPHEVPAGSFAFIKGKGAPVVLGKIATLALLCWRPCARTVDKTGDTKITSYYNLEDPKFIAVHEASQAKQDGPVTHYFGFEFLCLLDLPEGSTFATFYANSKTTRRIAKEKLVDLLGGYANFEADYIETSKYKWWGFKAEKSEGFGLTISQEEVDSQVQKFLAATKPSAGAPAEPENEGDDDNL